MAIVFMFTNPLGAFLYKRINPKLIILVGLTVVLSATYITTLTYTFSQFILTWGIIEVAGTGICYFPPLICGWEWFQDQKGIVTGVVLGAFGFSAFVFSFVALAVMNPDNEDPIILPNGHLIYSEEVASRVSTIGT